MILASPQLTNSIAPQLTNPIASASNNSQQQPQVHHGAGAILPQQQQQHIQLVKTPNSASNMILQPVSRAAAGQVHQQVQ